MEIFDIIVDYPDSLQALIDLKVRICLLFQPVLLSPWQECMQRVMWHESWQQPIHELHVTTQTASEKSMSGSMCGVP